MVTENLATLKIHKLTQDQYDRELAAGRIEENEIYLTPVDPDGNFPPASPDDNGKFLGVVDGSAAWVEMDTGDGIVLTEGVDYGTALPAEAPKGKIFFLKV